MEIKTTSYKNIIFYTQNKRFIFHNSHQKLIQSLYSKIEKLSY